jgi:uncharacterized glyoxalase superfamily protein PhnB
VLPYPDVREAVKYLEEVFGFRERLQIADHRSQMQIGDGDMIVAEYIDRDRRPQPGADHVSHQIMVRIADVRSHFDHAESSGAEILQPPTDHFFGERQYVVKDIGGHRWTFSQTIADSDPKEWGGDDVIVKTEL